MRKTMIIILILFGGTFMSLYQKYKYIKYTNGFDYSNIELMESIGSQFTSSLNWVDNINNVIETVDLVNNFTGLLISLVSPVAEAIIKINDRLYAIINKLFGDSDYYDKPLIPGEEIDIPLNPFRREFYRYWFKRDKKPGSNIKVVFDYGI